MSASNEPAKGIDPRGPRVTAGITGIVVLVVVALGLVGLTTAATVLLAAQAVVFLVAAIVGAARHPYGFVFKRLIRPRLAAPVELEDPAPPTFSQGVGFVVVALGIVLQLLGVPYAVVVAAGGRVHRRLPELGVRLLRRLPDLPAARAHRRHPPQARRRLTAASRAS